MTSAELISRAKEGDEAAFEMLFKSVEGAARFAASRSCRASHEEIDDCLQEMRLRLWRKLPLFRGDGTTFFAWARAMFHRLAIDLYRRRVCRSRVLSNPTLQNSAPLPDEVAIANEERRILRRLVQGIRSPLYRRAVELRYLREMSTAEIVAEVGCCKSTAKVRIHRGLRELRTLARTSPLLNS